jgi:hypothetical protein
MTRKKSFFYPILLSKNKYAGKMFREREAKSSRPILSIVDTILKEFLEFINLYSP